MARTRLYHTAEERRAAQRTYRLRYREKWGKSSIPLAPPESVDGSSEPEESQVDCFEEPLDRSVSEEPVDQSVSEEPVDRSVSEEPVDRSVPSPEHMDTMTDATEADNCTDQARRHGSASSTAISVHIIRDNVKRDADDDGTTNLGSSPDLGSRRPAIQTAHRSQTARRPMAEPQLPDSSLIQRGADLVKRCALTYDMDSMRTLVSFWMARGVNLAVGEDFVEIVTEAMRCFCPESSSNTDEWCLAQSRLLSNNTIQALDTSKATDAREFSKQFTQDNMRWETLGLFFCALARSTFDVAFYPPLLRDDNSILQVRKFAAETSGLCMDLCLALDCMNDLQLVLRYENLILHSYVDGGQRYRWWGKLGDVISSVYALGYHREMKIDERCPPYMLELRRAVFCSLFSADKNVALFLGHPPRMSRHFCVFQSPLYVHNNSGNDIVLWQPNTPLCYRSEMSWSGLCAVRKECIVELLSRKIDEPVQKASEIRLNQMEQWGALPDHFKYETSLRQASQSPLGRDQLVSVRLDHLHVLFLLKLLELERFSDPDNDIIEISQSIFDVVLEAILSRDKLISSGTGLVWRVVYFGIPAVSVILLAMLRKPKSWPARLLQSLNTFMTQVEMGTFVKENEPYYALLSQVTQTIRTILVFVSPSRPGQVAERTGPEDALTTSARGNKADDFYSPFMGSLNFIFDIDFWQYLEEMSAQFDGGLGRPPSLCI